MANEKKLVTFDNIQHYHNKLYQVVDTKQDSLVSGTNIKTINGQSILGDGDISNLAEKPYVDEVLQSIESKQDKIDNLVISEDVNEELDDVETNTYVKYVAQTLTEEQKSQVRSNIGVNLTDYVKTEDLTDYAKKSNLSNVATSGSYNDLTNKPTILSESDVNNLIDTKIGDINSILENIINGN